MVSSRFKLIASRKWWAKTRKQNSQKKKPKSAFTQMIALKMSHLIWACSNSLALKTSANLEFQNLTSEVYQSMKQLTTKRKPKAMLKSLFPKTLVSTVQNLQVKFKMPRLQSFCRPPKRGWPKKTTSRACSTSKSSTSKREAPPLCKGLLMPSMTCPKAWQKQNKTRATAMLETESSEGRICTTNSKLTFTTRARGLTTQWCKTTTGVFRLTAAWSTKACSQGGKNWDSWRNRKKTSTVQEFTEK